MRALRFAVLVLAVITAAWSAYLVRQKPAESDYQTYAQLIRDSQKANESVDQQVLGASYGLVPHYDGVNDSLQRLRSRLDSLRAIPSFLDEESLAELQVALATVQERDEDTGATMFELKERRVQRFENQHARLRAVQLYLPTVAGDLSERLRLKDPETSAAVEQILREMLTYNLLKDKHIGDRIDAEVNELEEFEERKSLAAFRDDMSDVIQQARFVTAAKPKVDGLTEWILRDRRLAEALKDVADTFDSGYFNAQQHDLARMQIFFALLIATLMMGAATIILTITGQREAIKMEHERAETLLLNVLPASIADLLKERPNEIIAESYADVSVLFADIVGFTPLASKLSPVELVEFLNRVFSAFDRLAAKHGLEKIKTLGDAYMVAGGLPERREDHAQAIANMALDMQKEILAFKKEAGEGFGMRIGINSGPVVAGVIGIKKFIYDLWGDAVNVASRMESHGVPNQIHCSASTYDRLKDRGYRFEERGVINVKGKGEMKTFLLVGRTEITEKQAATG